MHRGPALEPGPCDCGARDEAAPLFGEPIGRWHRWFAWRPVETFDHRRIWLRTVERRPIQKHEHLSFGPDWWWQYRIRSGYVE